MAGNRCVLRLISCSSEVEKSEFFFFFFSTKFFSIKYLGHRNVESGNRKHWNIKKENNISRHKMLLFKNQGLRKKSERKFKGLEKFRIWWKRTTSIILGYLFSQFRLYPLFRCLLACYLFLNIFCCVPI